MIVDTYPEPLIRKARRPDISAPVTAVWRWIKSRMMRSGEPSWHDNMRVDDVLGAPFGHDRR